MPVDKVVRSKASLEERLKRVNILVADNDPTIGDLIITILQTLGFASLKYVQDGYQAMDVLSDLHTDLLITDWELRPCEALDISVVRSRAANNSGKPRWKKYPPINGLSLVECIRHSAASPNPFLPVIMMTPPARQGVVFSARDAGVNEILVKPLNAYTLSERIISVIEHPRIFVTSDEYKGPCRRRKFESRPGKPERRKRTIQVIRFSNT